jgi:hypothetical protein
MSSGSVVILPAGVAVAAAAAVVLAAAAAAVVLVSAANQAAEAAVTALADYGETLEEAAGAQSRAAVDHLVWEKVAANVVELNARGRMLGERAKRARVPIAVPEPFSLTGRDAVEAARWCVRTAEELTIAQKALHTAVAITQTEEAAKGLPGSRSTSYQAETIAALDRYQEMLRSRYEPARVSAPAPAGATDADVETVLRKLDQDAYENERAEVLGVAAAAAGAGPAEAAGYLLGLRQKVRTVNATVRGRRLAAVWLVGLEEPAVAALLPRDPFTGTVKRLRAVVSGEEELTPELSRDARRANETAAELTRRAYLAAEVSSCLADLGYTVGEEFDLQDSKVLEIRREDWPDHLAQVSVNHEGVSGLVLRRHRAVGDQAEASDKHHCDVFHGSLQTVGRRVGAEVIVQEGARPQIIESGAEASHEGEVQKPRTRRMGQG